MKDWLLDYLCCPSCGGMLAPQAFERRGTEVFAGVLSCGCGAWYPVIRGVPRLLDASLRHDMTVRFLSDYRGVLDRARLARPSSPVMRPDQLVTLKTMRNFGFEWSKYARFGWDDAQYGLERTRRLFHLKSMFDPGELTGKVVLDAGCGNGRYTHAAAADAGRVIGVDVSDAVESAAMNTAGMDQVQVVQADLQALPFRDHAFDAVFAIGVLMHTTDPRLALASLARTLAIGGELSVHLYGKGNVFYETADRLIRSVTTRMSLAHLERFTDLAFRVRGRIGGTPFRGLLHLVRLDTHPHCIFDWYAAPVATHHTYDEVEQWLAEHRFTVVRTRRPPEASLPVRIKQSLTRQPGSVTLRSRRQPAAAQGPVSERT